MVIKINIMRNLITFLILLISLVSLSQNGKYKVTVRKANSDSIYYVNDMETVRKLMSDIKKRNFELKKAHLEYESQKLNKNLNLKLVEQEFNKLYINYIDSVFKIKKEYSKNLTDLTFCQLTYLLKQKNDSISHEQNNEKFKTLENRFDYFVKLVTYTGRIEYAEVIQLLYLGENEINAAKLTFKNFLKSKPHKKIMDNQKIIEKYLIKIDSKKELTKMFGLIPIPGGINIIFTMFIVFSVCFFETIFNTFLVLPILSIFLLIEHYSIINLRSNILDYCLADEIIYEEDAKNNSEYLSSIGESVEIDDYDRDEIFNDNFNNVMSKNSILGKIKNHYQFLILIVISYSIFYYFFKL